MANITLEKVVGTSLREPLLFFQCIEMCRNVFVLFFLSNSLLRCLVVKIYVILFLCSALSYSRTRSKGVTALTGSSALQLGTRSNIVIVAVSGALSSVTVWSPDQRPLFLFFGL